MRILVLGINYSPEPSGIAPYTAGMVRGLAQRGHDVRVITAFAHYPQWSFGDTKPPRTRHDSIDGVPVTRVRHYVPSTPTGIRRALSEVSFGLRAIGSRWRRPDVIVCVSPALLSSALVLGRAAGGRKTPVGLVVQDLYSAGMTETGASDGRAARVLTSIERLVGSRADGIVVIHDRFKKQVVDQLGIDPDRIDVVRNWTHVAPADVFDHEQFRERLGWSESKIVLHTGAMGEKQGLANVVEAARIADSTDSPVRFVLVGDGGQRRTLEEQARGVRSIEFLDALPDEDYGRALASADVLLVNERPDVKNMAVPSKLTSYFTSGRPVLAATNDQSTTADEVRASGAGVITAPGDPAALVRAVEQLCADRRVADDLGRRGPDYCATVLSEKVAIDGYDRWVRSLVRGR